MEDKALHQVCQTVYRQFPEMKGVKPSVKAQSADHFQLIFKCSVKAEDGKSLSRTVRVTASESGKILKLSTSR